MAKVGKTGNIAVAGITGTSTSKPMTDLNAANSGSSTSTKSSASGSGSNCNVKPLARRVVQESLSDKEDIKTPFAVYYRCGLPTAKEKQQKEDIQNGTE